MDAVEEIIRATYQMKGLEDADVSRSQAPPVCLQRPDPALSTFRHSSSAERPFLERARRPRTQRNPLKKDILPAIVASHVYLPLWPFSTWQLTPNAECLPVLDV